jgi:hypothetical protein
VLAVAVAAAVAAPPSVVLAQDDAPAAKQKRKKKRKGKKAKAEEAAAAEPANNDDIAALASGAVGDPEQGDLGLEAEPGEDKPAAGKGKESIPAPDALAAFGKTRVRKVGVPPFQGSQSESLRQGVLEVLSAHSEIEVVGYRDMEIAIKRLGADPATDPGRVRLATEFGLYGWVVGDGDEGHVRVIDASGRTLGQMALDHAARADMQVRDRFWRELGRYLSDEGLRAHRVTVAPPRGVAPPPCAGGARFRGEEARRARRRAEEPARAGAEGGAAARQAARRAQGSRGEASRGGPSRVRASGDAGAGASRRARPSSRARPKWRARPSSLASSRPLGRRSKRRVRTASSPRTDRSRATGSSPRTDRNPATGPSSPDTASRARNLGTANRGRAAPTRRRVPDVFSPTSCRPNRRRNSEPPLRP